jgi:uncharacterized UPF0160 family protein
MVLCSGITSTWFLIKNNVTTRYALYIDEIDNGGIKEVSKKSCSLDDLIKLREIPPRTVDKGSSFPLPLIKELIRFISRFEDLYGSIRLS